MGSSQLKEDIVEIHHVRQTAEVRVAGHFALFGGSVQGLTFRVEDRSGRLRVRTEGRENVPTAAAPAIDALFDVADHHAFLPACHQFVKQHSEVVPLHLRGVLKFVNHDVAQGGSNALIDERGVTPLHHVSEQNGRFGKHEMSGGTVGGFDLGIHVGQQGQRREQLQREPNARQRQCCVPPFLFQSAKFFGNRFGGGEHVPFLCIRFLHQRRGVLHVFQECGGRFGDEVAVGDF